MNELSFSERGLDLSLETAGFGYIVRTVVRMTLLLGGASNLLFIMEGKIQLVPKDKPALMPFCRPDTNDIGDMFNTDVRVQEGLYKVPWQVLINFIDSIGGVEQVEKILTGELVPELTMPLERNSFGHPIVDIVSSDRTGTEEIAYLRRRGFTLNKNTCAILESDEYDHQHRPFENDRFRLVFMPIPKNISTTSEINAAAERYGYRKILAGSMPRVRETVSALQMEEIGCKRLVGWHEPIIDPDSTLSIRERINYLTIWGDDEWHDGQSLGVSLDHFSGNECSLVLEQPFG